MKLANPELEYVRFEEFDLLNKSTVDEIESIGENISMLEFIELVDGLGELKDIFPEWDWGDMVLNEEEPESFGFFASMYNDMFCCYLVFCEQVTHMWLAVCDQCDDGLLEETCPHCNGSGEGCADGTTCSACGGQGIQIISCSCPLSLKHN